MDDGYQYTQKIIIMPRVKFGWKMTLTWHYGWKGIVAIELQWIALKWDHT
jgi:hypothetical protein